MAFQASSTAIGLIYNFRKLGHILQSLIFDKIIDYKQVPIWLFKNDFSGCTKGILNFSLFNFVMLYN